MDANFEGHEWTGARGPSEEAEVKVLQLSVSGISAGSDSGGKLHLGGNEARSYSLVFRLATLKSSPATAPTTWTECFMSKVSFPPLMMMPPPRG